MTETINGKGVGRPWPPLNPSALRHREEGGRPTANRPAFPSHPADKSRAEESKYAPKEWGEDWTYFAAPFGYDKVRMEHALLVLEDIRQTLPTLSIHSSLEYEGVLGEESGKHGEIQHVLDFFGVPKPARVKAHTCALHLCHRMAERCVNLIYIDDSRWYPQRTSYGVEAETAIARNLGKDVFQLTAPFGIAHLEVKFSKRPSWLVGFPLSDFTDYLRTQYRT